MINKRVSDKVLSQQHVASTVVFLKQPWKEHVSFEYHSLLGSGPSASIHGNIPE